MEKCLPELLSLMCESLVRKDLLSMVLTGYRGFLDPALDALWHDIPSLDPLIACLPEDLWKIERTPHPKNPNADYRTYHLRRPLRATDLQRYLDCYARRIRKLDTGIPLVWEDKSTILSRDTLRAIQIITNFNPGVLSPLLESFYWAPYPPDLQLHLGTGPSSTISEYIFLFLGDHVRNFGFPRLDNSDDHTYATILMNIADRFKDLEDIDLQSPYATPPTLDISPSDTFLSSSPWRCLRSLAVDSITLPTLLHIATMPLLMNLILHCQSHDTLRYVPGSTPSLAQPGYFRSIQDLSISCPRAGHCNTYTATIPPVQCRQHSALRHNGGSLT
ncbi:hypothetical protein DFP72DRAFT_1165640 [Ephemerocybe angulata]|uniref:Uncharacterized protein n=1 Tax=Ephemerocybe angulata TaxID=980116 RepID=A0A8H6IBJ1_9AGAR|nr:hypothetical protein DFP72DRAFT_1165640 [Tulosesus angulatus]